MRTLDKNLAQLKKKQRFTLAVSLCFFYNFLKMAEYS